MLLLSCTEPSGTDEKLSIVQLIHSALQRARNDLVLRAGSKFDQ